MTTLRTLLAVSETNASDRKETKEHPDLRLGIRLINDIRKKGIISSHDLLAVEDQPLDGTWGAFHHYTYGKEIGQKLADGVHICNIVADVSQKITNELGIKGKEQCRAETLKLCPTRFGMAECQSLSMLLTMDLVKAGCKRTINQVGIMQNHNMEQNFAHQFVIIGDCSALKDMKSESLDNFAKLGDDCILLDPKLYVIGQAKDAKALYAKYIKAFGYNRIDHVIEVDPAVLMKKIPTIESNLELVCSTIQERLGIKTLPKSHLDDSEYFKKMMNALLGCCKVLKENPAVQESIMQQQVVSRR